MKKETLKNGNITLKDLKNGHLPNHMHVKGDEETLNLIREILSCARGFEDLTSPDLVKGELKRIAEVLRKLASQEGCGEGVTIVADAIQSEITLFLSSVDFLKKWNTAGTSMARKARELTKHITIK